MERLHMCVSPEAKISHVRLIFSLNLFKLILRLNFAKLCDKIGLHKQRGKVFKPGLNA